MYQWTILFCTVIVFRQPFICAEKTSCEKLSEAGTLAGKITCTVPGIVYCTALQIRLYRFCIVNDSFSLSTNFFHCRWRYL